MYRGWAVRYRANEAMPYRNIWLAFAALLCKRNPLYGAVQTGVRLRVKGA